MKKCFLLIFIIILIPLSLGAHYIVGNVNDALDGENANTKNIVVWNPSNGILDNQTDIIGPTGNSGANNIYMIDCEMFNIPCSIGNTLSVKVYNTGDNYASETKNITVTTDGYDLVNDITLNSPPNTTLVLPINHFNTSSNTINFNCSFFDYDNNVNSVTLWGNWSNGWHSNETNPISGTTSTTFTKTLLQGTYIWNCYTQDNVSIGNFAQENKTFTVDLTPPIISDITINTSEICGNDLVTINCTTYDELLNIDNVLIQTISPTNIKTNYSTTFLENNIYSSTISIPTQGNWYFNCIANDSAGNEQNLTSLNLTVYSPNPELVILSSNLFINTTPTIENQIINFTAQILNNGCADANNLLIGFYEGTKKTGNNLENQTITLNTQQTKNISIQWMSKIGTTNISVYADLNNTYNEENEFNNNASKQIYLTAWQEIYGNTTVNKIIGKTNFNLSMWEGELNLAGNIYVTDSESKVNWNSLQAIRKTKLGGISSNDFSEIDIGLSMNTYNDSVYTIFSNSGTPKDFNNFTIFKKIINNVPIVNSSENGNFITGILWDTTDSLDNEYDSSEKEDLVFVAKINQETIGKYGTYDYEAKIPAKLREYDSTDTSNLYFYYELN